MRKRASLAAFKQTKIEQAELSIFSHACTNLDAKTPLYDVSNLQPDSLSGSGHF